MNENSRFISIVDTLRKQGIINDYVQLANTLHTNKAAISDIKSGRKKLSIEMLRRLKISYPTCNIDWIVTGHGDPFISDNIEKKHSSREDTQMFIEKISDQAQEIGRLKERIRQLERDGVDKDRLHIIASNPPSEMVPQPL